AVSITPTSWQGPVGASGTFSTETVYTDQYGRQSHVTPAGVNWQTTAGAISPNGGPVTTFSAGAAPATGTLTATAGFNGLTAQAVAQLKVGPAGTSLTNTATPTPQPSPTTAPVPGGTTASPAASPGPSPLSSADATRLAAMPTIFRPADPTNTDPVVNLPTLGCMEKAVGSQRFVEISSGQSQPTAAERKLVAVCFLGPEAIPAVLAPVNPTRIAEVPTTTDTVTLVSVKSHVVTTSTGEKVNGWLLTGTGVPNTSIFVYVFSDPLVLRTQSDNQGKWSYVLENPLATGHHEIYAVSEQESNTFVRTSAVPIQVAAAAPNPNGSLVVRADWTASQTAFAAGAALLVVVAILLFARLLRRRRWQPAAATTTGGPAPTLIQPSATMPPAQPTDTDFLDHHEPPA
ncbi:MAG TPA: hypothetical protein VI322_02855, partial [Candidatus Saccharimonadia bacterium]